MPAAKPKYMPNPRGWTLVQVAARIGMSLSWLTDNLEKMQREHGFPKQNPVTNRFNGRAVDAWMDSFEPLLAKARTSSPDLSKASNRVKEHFSGAARA